MPRRTPQNFDFNPEEGTFEVTQEAYDAFKLQEKTTGLGPMQYLHCLIMDDDDIPAAIRELSAEVEDLRTRARQWEE